ncbi:MAG TPA: helix-turn-helix domain-containing protein [Candidatus Desulfaltia sp.]|nr:helix-turn-helix domain-containing protein [Candidatus Desulfaltia sp.]
METGKTIAAVRFKSLAAEYRQKTGLHLVLVDLGGKIIHSSGGCDFCRKAVAGGEEKLGKNCRQKMAQAVEESFRWGEGYITTCPLGFVLFAVPIVQHKKLKGGLISGFAIFAEMKEDFAEEVSANLARFGAAAKPLGLRAQGVRDISLRRAKEAVSQLMSLTQKHQINDLAFLRERNEKYIQQYKIANFLEKLKRENPDIARKILDKQDEIIQKVKLGDRAGAREILNEFLGSIFFESGMNFEVIKVRIIELIVIISRAAIEAGVGAQELLGLNYSYLTELSKVTDLEELLFKVTRVLENFIAKVSLSKGKKRKVRCQRMRDFIEQNFTGKITARDVAGEAGLSVSRALHLFRQETGMALTGYINKLKLDYAKYLLLNSDISLAELAAELGYCDQSHFTKNFKKLEKITPSHFRLRYKTDL